MEQQARERLEKLSALRKIEPVDPFTTGLLLFMLKRKINVDAFGMLLVVDAQQPPNTPRNFVYNS